MNKNRKRSLKSRARIAMRRGTVTGGSVTLATLGLTTCTCDGTGGGVVDPLPPPPLTCKEADHGQNLHASGTLDSLSLQVNIYSGYHSYDFFDTVYVADVVGATLDSTEINTSPPVRLWLTLDSLATTEVKFTLKGTWNLKAGLCNFERRFTVTINGDQVEVAERLRRLPLEASRDVRIELVERDGLRVSLRAAVNGEGTPLWSVTAGNLERLGRLGVIWDLPADPGYYQIEVSVDRGTRGVGFDALALEVT